MFLLIIIQCLMIINGDLKGVNFLVDNNVKVINQPLG